MFTNPYGTHTYLSLVDTFTCAISLVLIIILASERTAVRVDRDPQFDVRVTCLTRSLRHPSPSEPLVTLEHGSTSTSFSAEAFRDFLRGRSSLSRMTERLQVNATSEQEPCVVEVSAIVKQLNEKFDDVSDAARHSTYFLVEVIRPGSRSTAPKE